ncbi:hypothetical protein ATANTOWER_013549 [Ataeniobius toweri]|uniref:Uncharacterized protein n=1 Tax=Ataeniobius toweri TaxID=208326 RepID=A0ABU7BN63_9TELE|nr:hypothetical protein [Ataeniobius toweri]
MLKETALFAPRRKRSACKAALRHRQYHCAPVSLLRDPEARIWGEEEEEEAFNLSGRSLPHSQGCEFAVPGLEVLVREEQCGSTCSSYYGGISSLNRHLL